LGYDRLYDAMWDLAMAVGQETPHLYCKLLDWDPAEVARRLRCRAAEPEEAGK